MTAKQTIDQSEEGKRALKLSTDSDRCLVYFDEDRRAHCPSCAEVFSDYMETSAALPKVTDNDICDIDHSIFE